MSSSDETRPTSVPRAVIKPEMNMRIPRSHTKTVLIEEEYCSDPGKYFISLMCNSHDLILSAQNIY